MTGKIATTESVCPACDGSGVMKIAIDATNKPKSLSFSPYNTVKAIVKIIAMGAILTWFIN